LQCFQNILTMESNYRDALTEPQKVLNNAPIVIIILMTLHKKIHFSLDASGSLRWTHDLKVLSVSAFIRPHVSSPKLLNGFRLYLELSIYAKICLAKWLCFQSVRCLSPALHDAQTKRYCFS
jgi:hypothetical protein